MLQNIRRGFECDDMQIFVPLNEKLVIYVKNLSFMMRDTNMYKKIYLVSQNS